MKQFILMTVYIIIINDRLYYYRDYYQKKNFNERLCHILGSPQVISMDSWVPVLHPVSLFPSVGVCFLAFFFLKFYFIVYSNFCHNTHWLFLEFLKFIY